YKADQHMLLLSGWPSSMGSARSCISTDEGATWKVFEIGTPLNGYAFIDDLHGVATNYHSGYYQHTTDGGLTWNDVDRGANETWQPLADTLHHLLWAASELSRDHTLDYSSDGGQNFFDLRKDFYSTGTLREGPCGTLYAEK